MTIVRRVIAALLLLQTFASATIEQIYSVHKDSPTQCPPMYKPDVDYIGCCPAVERGIVYATGPDGSESPGCCYTPKLSLCTGVPPVMYDWTIGDGGALVTLPPNVDRERPAVTGDAPQAKETGVGSGGQSIDGDNNEITNTNDESNNGSQCGTGDNNNGSIVCGNTGAAGHLVVGFEVLVGLSVILVRAVAL